MICREIVTGLLALGWLGTIISGAIGDHQNRKQLKSLIDQSVDQSKELVKLGGNVEKQAVTIDRLVYDSNQLEVKFQATLKEKDKKVGEQLGILTTQAQSIAMTTPASDTIGHARTSEAFMKQAGGVTIDQGLAWNGAYVQQNMNEMELLKKLLDQEKAEKAAISAKLSAESARNIQITGELVKKTEEHASVIGKVQVVEETLHAKNDWLAKLKKGLIISAILGAIGAALWAALHIYQLVSLKRQVSVEETRRREANEARYAAEKKAYDNQTAIKTFLNMGPEGNEQMIKILNANGLHEHYEEAIKKAPIQPNV